MTGQVAPGAPTWTAKWTRIAEWARVVLLAAAVACGARGYWDHFNGEQAWWRWLAEVLAGCMLFGIAVRRESPPPEAVWRRWARRACGAVSLAATVVAIERFQHLGAEVATGVAIAVALVAFLLARWVPFRAADVDALIGDPVAPSAQHPPFTPARVMAIVASLVAAIVAALVNPSSHFAAFALWLISLALFAIGLWQGRAPAGAGAASRWVTQGGPQLSVGQEAVAFALVLALAVTLRVVLPTEAPAIIDADEGRQGRYAERIWEHGFPDAFDVGWNVFPHLSYMVEYTWVQGLGTSNAHLRLAAATVGVLGLIPAYFWARRWWGNIIALVAMVLLAGNWEHLTWSRIALNNIQQVLVAGLMLAAFARVLRTQRWIDWVWFGYATGLAFHTYHAAKLFPALIAAAALLFAVGIRGFVRRYAVGALIGGIAFLLCFGPLMVTIYQKWDAFYGGTSNRSDLAQLTTAYQHGDAREVRGYLQSHVLGCLYSFISTPSFRAATFDPLVAVPFLLGVGWMLWYWRDPRHLFALVWTAGILGIGGMITDYPPWKARLLGYLPVIFVIAAVVVGRMRETLHRCLPRRADLVATPLLALFVGGALYYNVDTEFVYWPSLQRGVDLMREICRVVDNTPTPATFYMARGGETVDLTVSINDCMIAPDPQRRLVNLPDDPAIVPVPPTNNGTAVLLVTAYQEELLPLIRHYYPQARYTVVRDPRYNGTVLHVITLPVGEIERSRGLRATYQTAERTWSSDTGTVAYAPPAEPVAFPLHASWRGQVWIATPGGGYALRSSGGAVRLDGAALAGESTGILAAGWHPIELSATLHSPSEHVTLEWKPPGATEWTAIPQAALHTHPEGHGLLGRYFAREITTASPDPIAAPPDLMRIENALSFDYLAQQDDHPPPPLAARPSTMEWVGTVEIPEGEPLKLRLEATTPAQVFLNGKQVLSAQGKRGGEGVEVELSDLHGRVPILVRNVRPEQDDWLFWKLRLLWREPGGGWNAFVSYRPPQEGQRTTDN